MDQKKLNIAICIPSSGKVDSAFALQNLPNIIAYTKDNLKNLGNLFITYHEGVRTDKNRNVMLKRILDDQPNMDYILWLDEDMLYPHDIICKYLEIDFDVIGCLYFKRTEPFYPVGYVSGTNPIKPYRNLIPNTLPENSIVEVDGLGFGGMMVNMRVYKAMGEDKWMHYGNHFYLPYDNDDGLTHDLEFCKNVKQYGFKILLHTGIKPGHIASYVVTEKDFYRAKSEEKAEESSVVVIMPTIHPEIAVKTAKILKTRADYPHKMCVVEDTAKRGFVAVCNDVIKDYKADYYVYLTDDIFPSRGWLKGAINKMKEKDAKLFGFNDGKYKGLLATCGVVEAEWMRKNYDGNMFFPEYFGHYNDTELTMVAMNQNVYAYDPTVCLIEVDYDKEKKKVNKHDKDIFKRRKLTSMEGLVTNQEVLEMFT